MAENLGFSIPERTKPGKQDLVLRPKPIAKWIDALPQANVGETARQLYQVLQATNKLDYPFTQRAQFLTALREPVHYVTDAMRKHFIGMTYPLPNKNQKVSSATREIYKAMATGYKICVQELANTNSLLRDKKLLTTMLHRAMTYSGKVLLTAYQVYSPYPNNTWRDIHALYQYAERNHLHKTKIEDFELQYQAKSTIQSEYIRILLLSLTSPYNLRQGEVVKIYHTLEHWTGHCRIESINPKHPPEGSGHFLVRLEQDIPPRPVAHTAIVQDQESHYRVIHTDNLAHLLRREIQDNEEVVSTTLTSLDLSKDNLPHDLLRRLLVAWGVDTRRQFPRTSKKVKVEVAVGLSATHKFIQHMLNRNARDSYSHKAEFTSSIIKHVTDIESDVWGMVYPEETRASQFDTSHIESLAKQEFAEMKSAVATPKPVPREDALDSDHWCILNESASGYCIEYEDETTTKAQVGELVGIRRSVDGKTWKWGIGVIRWLKFTQSQTLQLGVEMLNPDAAAIGIRPRASRDKDNLQRTLMLPEIKAINQPASLITGPVPWRVGQQAVLKILTKELDITLTKLIQHTGQFAQFAFEIHDHQNKAKPVLTDTVNGEVDLSSIWSSI